MGRGGGGGGWGGGGGGGGGGGEEVGGGGSVFALIDVPLAAVRRYIEMNMAPPADVDGYVRKTFETILGACDENQ